MSFEKHIMKRKKVPFLSFVLLGILIMGCVFAPFFCKDASYMDLMNCSRAPGCNPSDPPDEPRPYTTGRNPRCAG